MNDNPTQVDISPVRQDPAPRKKKWRQKLTRRRVLLTIGSLGLIAMIAAVAAVGFFGHQVKSAFQMSSCGGLTERVSALEGPSTPVTVSEADFSSYDSQASQKE